MGEGREAGRDSGMQSYQRLQKSLAAKSSAPTWWALQLALGPSLPCHGVWKILLCLSCAVSAWSYFRYPVNPEDKAGSRAGGQAVWAPLRGCRSSPPMGYKHNRQPVQMPCLLPARSQGQMAQGECFLGTSIHSFI